jgi:hypothetical protein
MSKTNELGGATCLLLLLSILGTAAVGAWDQPLLPLLHVCACGRDIRKPHEARTRDSVLEDGMRPAVGKGREGSWSSRQCTARPSAGCAWRRARPRAWLRAHQIVHVARHGTSSSRTTKYSSHERNSGFPSSSRCPCRARGRASPLSPSAQGPRTADGFGSNAAHTL